MEKLGNIEADYVAAASGIAAGTGSNEETYYPAIQSLLTSLLKQRALPFNVRTGTSQTDKGHKGTDKPDIALYDGDGDYPVVLGEVKLPGADLQTLTLSTENNNQIGRYLARTGVVVLTNVRGFCLVASSAGRDSGPVVPSKRRVVAEVEVWPSESAMRAGKAPLPGAIDQLADLVETAVTEFAPISEPESLARILARQAKRAKAGLPPKFSQAVQPLLDDFGRALGMHFEGDEGEEFLRSSLIQTIFYGLFAGWTLWHRARTKKAFRWEDLGEYLQIPFLGALFHEFEHPMRLKELGLREKLDAATATLSRVDIPRFFSRFAAPQFEDGTAPDKASTAILYFYEPFLEAFDPELRKQLGVWYTPWQIVRYQVRRVEQLLRTELGCPRGFADERVVVLDTSCGTGAYLIEVLRAVARQLDDEGEGKLKAAKLRDVFCRRLIGFEILTAPFVVAQLQLYLLLSDLGVEPDDKHRPAVFLTNALTGWEGAEQLKLRFPELQLEHDAARRVKREQKIIVIIGNPPYNRFAGVPLDEEADLVDHYKGIRRDKKGKQIGKSLLFEKWGIRKQLLDDLYVRFFRLAEIRIGEKADNGVVSFISNSSYMTGRSHPLMRESLLANFEDIWIDNLNGDKYRTGKVIPEGMPGAGTSDQSAFSTAQDPRGIQVGAAITTLLKRKKRDSPATGVATVQSRDFWGRADRKRAALLESLDLGAMSEASRAAAAERPEGPRAYEVVTPERVRGWRLIGRVFGHDYEDWPALDDLFPVHFQGINPNRGLEGSIVDIDKIALIARMRDYFSDISFAELEGRYPELTKDRADYSAKKTRDELLSGGDFDPTALIQYEVFPLDSRFLYFSLDSKLINRPRPELWENRQENLFLISVPECRRVSEARPLCSSALFDLHISDRGAVGFPWLVRPAKNLFDQDQARLANLLPAVWEALKKAWSLKGADLACPAAHSLTRDLMYAALAVGHAPSMAADHGESIRQDWLHVPIPKDHAELKGLSKLGATIAHLLDPNDNGAVAAKLLGTRGKTLAVIDTLQRNAMEEDLCVTVSYFGAAPGKWITRGPREDEATHERWGEQTGDLYLNESVFIRNVPEAVWRFELGGYPILKKWLGYREAKRRDGAPLRLDEVEYLRSMVHRIAALLTFYDTLDPAYIKATSNAFTAEELGIG